VKGVLGIDGRHLHLTMMPKLRPAFLLLGVALPALLLTACNTTRGVGQDIKSIGRAIERAAD
jgi:predicted small secreted protein